MVYGQHNQQIIWPSGQLLTHKQSKIGGAFMACLAMPAFLNFALHHSATVALRIPTLTAGPQLVPPWQDHGSVWLKRHRAHEPSAAHPFVGGIRKGQ